MSMPGGSFPSEEVTPGRRSLGQHFLNSVKFAERIVQAAGVDHETVIEIGAGRGILTRPLAQRAKKVVAVELDRRLARRLEEEQIPGVEVLNRDFLDLELDAFRAPVIVGNIPYAITTAIIEKLGRCRRHVKHAVLTVQQEFAGRMAAAAGSRRRGYLSVYAHYHFAITRAFAIPARFFSPVPRVNSAVVRLEPRAPLLDPESEQGFFELVAGIFRYRRKSVKNALRNHLGRPVAGPLPELFARRPQELEIEDFRRLYEFITRGQ